MSEALKEIKRKERDKPDLVKAFEEVDEKEREYAASKRIQERIVKSIVKAALIRLEPFVHDFGKLQETESRLTDLINIMLGNAELEKNVLEKINARLDQQ